MADRLNQLIVKKPFPVNLTPSLCQITEIFSKDSTTLLLCRGFFIPSSNESTMSLVILPNQEILLGLLPCLNSIQLLSVGNQIEIYDQDLRRIPNQLTICRWWKCMIDP